VALDFDEDLKEMLSEDEHGVSYKYRGQSYEGIFNEEFLSQDVGRAGMESTTPVLYARSVDIVGIEHEEIIELKGRVFSVVGDQPDGTGLTMLVLEYV